MSDTEFMELYSNKHMEKPDRPLVRSSFGFRSRRKSVYKRLSKQRHMEDADEVADSGMDIGDYDFIDKHLVHCPAVDWVELGMVLPTLKNQKKCGSCWAHSTVAAVESLYARYNNLWDSS